MKSLLLIYPPVAKNCEPPAGIARLAGVLRANDVCCSTLDLNRLSLDYLLALENPKTDTWSKRAKKNRVANIHALQQGHCYLNFSRYKRAVADINRYLAGVGEVFGSDITLANYQDRSSPVESKSLLQVAETFQENLFFPLFTRHVGALIEKDTIDVVGISLNYLSQAVAAFALIGFLRARYSECRIVLGGGLVTSWLRSPLWNNPFAGLVDTCFAGPGEKPLFAYLGGKEQQLCYDPPDYDRHKYLSPGGILPYAASTGCYWNKCLFCPETAESNPYIAVAPGQVIKDLQVLSRRHSPLLIHFLDNAISPLLLKELAANPPGVSWYGFARANPLLADGDFCRKLAASGCVMLKLGLESGDQQVLDTMHKGIDLALVSAVLHALHAAGIMTYVYLLFGTPGEDYENARKTLEFTVNHQEAIGFLNLAVFNLPLGGAEASTLDLSNFYTGDLSLYTDFTHPMGWSRPRIRTFLDKEFKRHPYIAPIIQRDPPTFTSNHAPLFHPAVQDTLKECGQEH